MTRANHEKLATTGDAELLGLFARDRDEAAFAALVERHGPMVLGVCRRVLRDFADADDAFQATFLLLAMRAGRIREPGLLGNWLFGVAARKAIGVRRADARRAVREKRLMAILGTRKSASADDADLRMTLDEQVKRLPDRLRRVVVCCYLQGLTKREAAAQLKWAEGTVTARLKEAREMLRARLGGKGLSISEEVLGSILAPVAVPVVLRAATVKAGAGIAAGEVGAGGAASVKAVAMAKASAKAIFIAKVKLAAVGVMASTVIVVGAASVAQRDANPSKQPSPAQAATTLPRAPVAGGANKGSFLRHAIVEIWGYASEHGGHLPPDLKAVNLSGPFQYLGNSTATRAMLNGHSATVLVAEISPPGSTAPVNVARADGGSVLMSAAEADQWISESKAFFDAIRQSGGARIPAGPEAPLPKAKLPLSKASLPEEVRKALEENAVGVIPIRVSWTRSASSPLGVDTAQSRFYVELHFFSTWSERAVLDGGRMYWWTGGTRGEPYEGSIDGAASTFTYSTPTQFATQPLKPMSPSNRFDVLFLEWAGLRSIVQPADFGSPGGDTVTPVLRLLKEGAAVMAVDDATVDGRPMKRVSVMGENDRRALHKLPETRDYVYYFDPRLHYALRRSEERYGNRMIHRTDNEQFQRLGEREVWLPHRSVRSHFTYRMVPDQFFAVPILVETLELAEVSTAAVPSESFVLKPRPGVNVINGRLVGGRQSSGGQTANTARPAEDVLAGVKTVAPSRSFVRPTVLAGGGLVAGLLIWVTRRRVGKSR